MKSSHRVEKFMVKRWIRSKRRRYQRRVSRMLASVALGGALAVAAPSVSRGDLIWINSPETGTVELGEGDSLNVTDIGSIFASGDGGEGVDVTSSTVAGNITNAGLIESEHDDAIFIDTTSTVSWITNSGTIIAGIDGIEVYDNSVITGIITNTNTGTITAVDVGILLSSDSSVGSISNSGTITAGDAGIYLGSSSTVGWITNTDTGIIKSTGDDGIEVSSSSEITGDIINTGTITAFDDGIILSSESLVGGNIVNTGIITAGDDGIEVYLSSEITGDIINIGNITAGNDGIILSSDSLVGGNIVNFGSIIGTNSDGDGIQVYSYSEVRGDIINIGSITGQDGINLGNQALVGGNIVNSGTITAGDDGIDVDTNSEITGDIINTGSITADEHGIVLSSDASVGGNIVNTGTIIATLDAIIVKLGTVVHGDITNSGTLNGGLKIESNTDLVNDGTLNLRDIYSNEIGGNLTQSNTGTLAMEFTTPGSSTPIFISVGGDAVLDGLLNVTFADGFSLVAGNTIELLDITGTLSGTFSNYPEGASLGTFGDFYLNLTYAGGNVVAYASAVPEPATLVLLAFGGLPLLVLRRR